ncbi:hypothetical protein ANN_03770 [Periplaneta americana]|uniref:Reverse transcriptase domain-containing protein n=1 Tax=Periplaneta americana TaxID=6978 RepID=A0ABQ8U3S1_PERAM|nr:hypothetical protein ANN_03770 [Periplaneta americana]
MSTDQLLLPVQEISCLRPLFFERDGSTEISQNFASLAQITTYTVAMTAIDPSSSFVPIPLQPDVIVVHRSGEVRNTLKAIGLEVNPEKTKYMIMSRDQNIVRNGKIKISDLTFEEVEKFMYLGATVTNINDTREEMKRRIKMGNASYYSIENLLPSSLLSKNLKDTIYKTVILPVVLYGCETWTVTSKKEQRLWVFVNNVLRKIFGAEWDEVAGEWRKLHKAELHALLPLEKKWEYKGTVHQLFIDFKKAYDTVKREVLYDMLIEFGIPKKLVGLIKMCLNETYSRVRIGQFLSDVFPIHCGLKQGDALSPLLFNFALELRVFENKVLRKIFGAKRDKVTGEWRKLHNTELHALYSSPDITRNIKSRRLRWAGHVALMGESRNACRVLIGRPEGKRLLGMPRRKWEDNIKMDLREVGYGDRGWINLAQDGDRWRAYVRAAMNLRRYTVSRQTYAIRRSETNTCTNGTEFDSTSEWDEGDNAGEMSPGSNTESYPAWGRIYKAVILPVVLYGCETWTLTLREEQRLRVFENKVLREIFGTKRDEVTGEWRKLHNAELHALYSSPDIIRNIKSRRSRWAGHVARMGESRNAYRVLVGRPEGKRPLGRPRRRWEDNIKMDLRYDDKTGLILLRIGTNGRLM